MTYIKLTDDVYALENTPDPNDLKTQLLTELNLKKETLENILKELI